jgi:hypothetical protein
MFDSCEICNKHCCPLHPANRLPLEGPQADTETEDTDKDQGAPVV